MVRLARKNKTTDIRRDLMRETLKCYLEDRLQDMDKLPVLLFPKTEESYRCCVYKDRFIVRNRILAILGHGVENEDDNLLLSEYAKKALERKTVEEPILTIIDEACSSCVKLNYHVTDACRGCVARPCAVNCPQKAIAIKDHKSHIDPAKCVTCGICQKVCPYNAIIYIPVPCEEGCPVDAIHKGPDGKENIDYDKCMYCGKCTRNCPFSAIIEKTQIIDVAKSIKEGGNVIALVAPSIMGQYAGNLKQIVSALKAVGFSKVYEVALGADITAEIESKEFSERMRKGDPMMGTSCCPAYLETVKKHAPEFQKYVSHAKTPMSYAAEIVERENPGSIKVFIGPCITKKFEGIHDNNVDYVLTYEELDAFFQAKGIHAEGLSESDFDNKEASRFGRGFAVTSGVAGAIIHNVTDIDVKTVLIDGLDRAGVARIQEYAKGQAPGNLIEVMSCTGGCVAGPGVVAPPKVAAAKLKKLMDEQKE